jgi:hypothetical protein
VLSSSSSSSSLPPLTEDEEEFKSILPETSSLRYDQLGYFTQVDLDKLKADWNLSGESGGILQGIPSFKSNKQAR